MQLEARVFVQPGLHIGRFVGCVVVEHQMDIAPRWHGLVDVPEEFQELLCAVTRHAVADDLARLHIECCEQRGRAVALVVVGQRGRTALLER